MLQPGADWRAAAPANVDVLFTCREGGVSSGPWGDENGAMGLNGAHGRLRCLREDEPPDRLAVGPLDRKWLKQVHGTRVAAETVEGEPEADAALFDDARRRRRRDGGGLPPRDDRRRRTGRAVCAVHAGWRGLADGVVQMGVKAVRDAVGDDEAWVVVWLGPRIGPEALKWAKTSARR